MQFIKILIFILFIFSYTSSCFGFLDSVVLLGSWAYQKLSNNYCSKKDIPSDFKALRSLIKGKIFGQPLIESTVVNALRSHWDERSEPEKALTISFHGGPGVGKNYVAKFIEQALYSQGIRSPNVHNFNARLDFPKISEVDQYKKNLENWISGNVSRCPKQLFLFDEVNQMPPGILDALKPFIDHFDDVKGISYKRAIFLFLSNTGSEIINENSYYLWSKGIKRNEIKLHFFEKLISQGSFNEKGGFQYSATIKSNLIDHYIPFLPLMKSHVRMCIEEEFRKNFIPNPTEEQIQAVLDFIDWGPEADNGVFAKTGCKRISQKVRLLAVDDEEY
ncbi:torsin-1A [Harmonia axyridis]|uniref:torsin-1A n=1 Tax=Harmonia axyridis TaxID=115357 RepID=UPI001E279968|nr:torsin-1A [Harmonia axyridis]